MKILCPACGGEVQFKSRASIFGVCSYCSSTLVRHDKNIETLGKMSEMPQDMSPVQMGTSGKFGGSRFEVVGRQKVGWKNGSWNEWYILFENGKEAWLADAQGNYMISFEESLEKVKPPPLAEISVSKVIVIGGVSYTVDDIKEVTCIGSQGELPMKSIKGRKSTSVDLVGNKSQFGNIDYSEDGTRIYLGKYEDFENLKFMNLREIDGW